MSLKAKTERWIDKHSWGIGVSISLLVGGVAVYGALKGRRSTIIAEKALNHQTRDVRGICKDMIRTGLRDGSIGVDKPEFKLPVGLIDRKSCDLVHILENNLGGYFFVGDYSGCGKSGYLEWVLSSVDRPVIYLEFREEQDHTSELHKILGIETERLGFSELLHCLMGVFSESEFSDLCPLFVFEDPKYLKDKKGDLVAINSIGNDCGKRRHGTAFMVGSQSYSNRLAFAENEITPHYMKNVEYLGVDEASLVEALGQIGYDERVAEVILVHFGGYLRGIEEFFLDYGVIGEVGIVEELCSAEVDKLTGIYEDLFSENEELVIALADGTGIKKSKLNIETNDNVGLAPLVDDLIEIEKFAYFNLDRVLVLKNQIHCIAAGNACGIDMKKELIENYRRTLGEEFFKWKI